ncbi:unnamed protein product, partial [Effrenium voratum]
DVVGFGSLLASCRAAWKRALLAMAGLQARLPRASSAARGALLAALGFAQLWRRAFGALGPRRSRVAVQHGAGRLLRRRLGDLRNGCLESGRRAAEMHGAQPGSGGPPQPGGRAGGAAALALRARLRARRGDVRPRGDRRCRHLLLRWGRVGLRALRLRRGGCGGRG